jgi:hypothetical protein
MRDTSGKRTPMKMMPDGRLQQLRIFARVSGGSLERLYESVGFPSGHRTGGTATTESRGNNTREFLPERSQSLRGTIRQKAIGPVPSLSLFSQMNSLEKNPAGGPWYSRLAPPRNIVNCGQTPRREHAVLPEVTRVYQFIWRAPLVFSTFTSKTHVVGRTCFKAIYGK